MSNDRKQKTTIPRYVDSLRRDAIRTVGTLACLLGTQLLYSDESSITSTSSARGLLSVLPIRGIRSSSP